jgi:hypothetical protein
VTAADGIREAAFADWWSGAWEALPADEDAAHEAFCAGWEAARAKVPGSSMDIPQSAIDWQAAAHAAVQRARQKIQEATVQALHDVPGLAAESAEEQILSEVQDCLDDIDQTIPPGEDAGSGTCALHGDLDQAVILHAVSDPASFVGTRQRLSETISHWQMRAVVASLTRPDPAIPTGGTT